jgi:hypothetical protein
LLALNDYFHQAIFGSAMIILNWPLELALPSLKQNGIQDLTLIVAVAPFATRHLDLCQQSHQGH